MSVNQVTMTLDGLKVSRFIAGFWRLNQWQFSDSELQAYVEALLELGISTMDHAFVYRSESQFGRVLNNQPDLRKQIQLVSKFGIRPQGFGALGAHKVNHYDSSAAYLIKSVENSLQALCVETLDLILVHRPDYLMRADELAEAFHVLHAQGKVKYFGVSNFNPSQFSLLQNACDFTLVTNQIETSVLHLDSLDNGVLDQCQNKNLIPMFWSCLGGGRLWDDSDIRARRVRAALRLVAEQHAVNNIEQIAYAWLLSLPCQGLPILGSRNIDRVKNAIAAENTHLSREQWYSIWEASNGACVP